MNEELKALRPKPARQCTTRSFTQPMSSSGANQSNAYDSLMAAIARRSGADIGGSESIVSMTASGSPSCAKEKGDGDRLATAGGTRPLLHHRGAGQDAGLGLRAAVGRRPRKNMCAR